MSNGKALRMTPASRIPPRDMQPTVWHRFTPLAKELNACNLGQGFPDWPIPEFLKQAMCEAVKADFNQYSRSQGTPELCQKLAEYYAERGLNVEWDKQVCVSSGATEAMLLLCQSLLEEGDEVLVLEPIFDNYLPQIKSAGGKVVPVPLDASKGQWSLDLNTLRTTLSQCERARVLILNSPHNPTGRMLKSQEVDEIAEILKDYPDVVVVTDEVYEHMTYNGNEHLFLGAHPALANRTVTMSSASKTFGVTGWKIGWAVGPEHLIYPMTIFHQFVSFCVSTPAQIALASALDTAKLPYEGKPSYFEWLRQEYERKRGILLQALEAAGLETYPPDGGFFIIADCSNVLPLVSDKYRKMTTPGGAPVTQDWAISEWLAHEVGVATIPLASFYTDEHKERAATLVRFAFCKQDDVLHEAAERLAKIPVMLQESA
ncbi:MAG: hypothetical protein MHM6MM_008663 [Cercozoa sp. M6MM]